MRLIRSSKIKPKIRYDKEPEGYCLKINKRFLDEFDISLFLKVEKIIWEDMLLNTYKATKQKSRYGYPIYTFETVREAKSAINYLRSLLIMDKIL